MRWLRLKTLSGVRPRSYMIAHLCLNRDARLTTPAPPTGTGR
ncbi:hypothetical protein ARMA_2252 [Ardenticatena maritima]|uniref:Uncharacterized protein n=1 Tax=Ardenticatena maritima TaxID=872965 RepID=A0A0M8KAK6_9CHLR|nr:hypothetical protein ARMA_2252 [Ardenticatena maritima]